MAEAQTNLSILVRVRDEASAALNRLGSEVSELGGSLNFAGDKAGILAGALAAVGATAVLKSAITSFADAEAKLASFDAILRTLPPNLQKFRGEIVQVADKALTKFGFDNENAALSIGRLFQATQNAPEAFQAFQTAMDLSRAKGIDLAEATQLLIVAFMGGGRILKQYGIDVDEHASKATILAAITQKLAGQTEAYSQTLSGQLAIGRQILNEFSEALGSIFAPAIKLTIGWIVKAIEHFGGMKTVLEGLKPLLIFLASFLAITFVLGVGAATVALLGMIGVTSALIAAILAISAAITVVAVYWQQIINFMGTIFYNFGVGFTAVVQRITGWFRSEWDSAIAWLRSQLQSLVDFFNYVVGLVSHPISTAVKGASDTLSGVISSLKGILHLQGGGIITRPSFAAIGEHEPEAVIPLSRLGALGGGGLVINLNGDFYTDMESAERFANQIAKIIKFQLKL